MDDFDEFRDIIAKLRAQALAEVKKQTPEELYNDYVNKLRRHMEHHLKQAAKLDSLIRYTEEHKEVVKGYMSLGDDLTSHNRDEDE